MENYRPRLTDSHLDMCLKSMGAVLIEGPKGCGKTTSAKQFAKSSADLQDKSTKENYQLIQQINSTVILDGEIPRLIDEWQSDLALWDAAKIRIDFSPNRGLYIFTGSVAFDRFAVMHPGTGRIAVMRMDVMSLYESGESLGNVSLADLFENKFDAVLSELSIEDYSRLVVRGGWPDLVGKTPEDFKKPLKDYFQSLIKSEIRNVDGTLRDENRTCLILKSLSRNLGASVPDTKIQSDIEKYEKSKIHVNTVRDYVFALERMFIVQNVRAWVPYVNTKAVVRRSYARHFCDPSVAAYFLGVNPDSLMGDIRTFALLFKSLAIRDLRIYVRHLNGEIMHYLDSDGLEIDAIIRWRDKWAAVNVRLGFGMVDEAAKKLIKLSKKVKTDHIGEPAFLAVITGTQFAYRREDGVYVIPLGCLKP